MNSDLIVGTDNIFTINKSNGTIGSINSLENRIEKLEEGFGKIERKIEMEKRRRIYDLMGRVGELNKYDNSVINGEVIGRVQLD